MAEKPTISFDEQGRVRVLDAEQFRKTEELESECRTFVSSKHLRPGPVQAWLALRWRFMAASTCLLCRDSGIHRECKGASSAPQLSSRCHRARKAQGARRLQRQSLGFLCALRPSITVTTFAQAIGARNIVASEPETRRRKQREMQALIDERVAEHDRYARVCRCSALCRVPGTFLLLVRRHACILYCLQIDCRIRFFVQG